MLAAVAALAAIAYLLTPLGASGEEGAPVGFRLNIRYLAPGLALALLLIPIAATRLPAARPSGAGSTLALFVALTVVSVGAVEEIDTDRIPGTALLALAVIGLPLALCLLFRRGVPRGALLAAGAVAFVGLAVAGRFAQEDYLELRYSSAAPDYPRSEQPAIELGQGLGAAYDWARESATRSIALSGTTGALFGYGLWGEDASNAVRYIGERGDRGSFREITECPEWVAAINQGDFDFVVTTPEYHQDDPEAATVPRERAWIDGRAATAQRVAGAGLVDVWQLAGPLDPAACAAVARPVRSPPSRPSCPAAGRGADRSATCYQPGGALSTRQRPLPMGGGPRPAVGALRDPRMAGRVTRAVEAVRDELRRRIGATFTVAELAELYASGTDWCLEAATEAGAADTADLDPQAITDGAFYLHLRSATDYAGGRLIPTD